VLENAIKDLSKYRFEKAEQMLKASKISCEQEDWCSANLMLNGSQMVLIFQKRQASIPYISKETDAVPFGLQNLC